MFALGAQAVVANGDSIVTQIFKFGFPFIGTALIILWAVLLLPRPNPTNHQDCCGVVVRLVFLMEHVAMIASPLL
jgi:hypothetical protein